MSLQVSIGRALNDKEELRRYKTLLLKTKELQLKEAVETALKTELQDFSIEELRDSDRKEKIIDNIMSSINDLVEYDGEYNFFYYHVQELYDKTLNKLEREQKQKQKEQEQKQKEQEQIEQEAEKIKIQEAARRQAIIDLFFKILGIIGLILLAPLIFCIFIIFEALKNTK